MTGLLQRAISEVEKLPTDQQDIIAERILADLKDEQVWAARFDATTDNQWDRIAEMVRGDIVSGDIVALDDVFPSDKSKP